MFLQKHKYPLIILLIYLAAELIVRPYGNYPLNDDWTYGMSVLKLLKEGKYDIGLSAASIFTHLMWGFGFTKLFGFSFFVLRLSTLLSSVTGLYLLFRLVSEISNSKPLAFLATLTLLFNPVYFNLSNTYMTDVNFNTLLVACCYLAYRFHTRGSAVAFVLFFVMSVLLVLLRQFGIVVPVAFVLSLLFNTRNRWLWVALAIGGTLAVFGLFKYYEAFLKSSKEPLQCYQFSGNTNLMDRAFWERLLYSLQTRYGFILLHMLIYPAPFVMAFLLPVVRSAKPRLVLLLAPVCAGISILLFRNVEFPLGNIFYNMHLGADTFYESIKVTQRAGPRHLWSDTFSHTMLVFKSIVAALHLLVLSLAAFSLRKRILATVKRPPPPVAFFILTLGFYLFALLSFEGHFDRYHLPTITFLIILFSYLHRHIAVKWGVSYVLLAFFMYVSVAGTRDYFTMNDRKWEAYEWLKTNMNAYRDEINGGLEINCWHEGTPWPSYDFEFLENHKYLIQYNEEKDFRLLREFPFQRYFPWKKDKINIFVRMQAKEL